jgi:carbon monoxide dehydrogenase subunit G
MARTEVNRQAPILLTSEIEVGAPPEVVWDVLATIESWPTWNPGIKSASLQGDLVPGSAFRWKSGLSVIRSRLVFVDPPREIAWTGKSMGINVVHVYSLEGRGGRTLVKTEESVEGITARPFRSSVEKTMDGAVDAGLQRLKAEAERRAAR